jgi:hypothetical protein
VNSIATISTTISASGTDVTPASPSTRNAMIEMKAPIM